MSSRQLVFLLMVALLGTVIFAPMVLTDTYLTSHYLPSPLNILLFAIAILLVMAVRDPVMQLVSGAWASWFLFGNIHIVGSYFRQRLLAPLYVQDANTLFLLGIIAFIIGVLCQQFLLSRTVSRIKQPPEQVRPGRIVVLVMLCFPLVYAASLAIWRVPTVLGGENIINEMYEVDKGPIYALRPLLALTMVIVVLLIQQQATFRQRLALVVYLAAVVALSVVDGKRDIALIGLAAAGVHLTIHNQGRIAGWQIGVAVAALAGYMGIADLRAASIGTVNNGLLYLMTAVGVEYKDFVHSYNYLSIEYMNAAGYDWARSSIANLFNRSILGVFGIDKDAWTEMDSARTWMRVYRVSLGIRTGILSELYYAFGWGMFIGMGLLGFLMGWLAAALRNTRSSLTYLALLVLLANLAISIVSQSTAVVGIAVTLLYAYLALFALTILTRSVPARQSLAREH